LRIQWRGLRKGLKQIIRAVGPLAECDAASGTGFSRESVGCHAAELRVFTLASSRLKPVLQEHRIPSVRPVTRSVRGCIPTRSVGNDHLVPSGTGFSREAFDLDLLLIFIRKKPKHHKSRLGCRPNADDAQWAEPHGCGESAVRTWMSVRRGPTERRRSEGIPTKEGPSQEQAPLVTWGAFPSNSPKAKQRPLGRRS
jgi:hypothetical protein